MTITVLNHDDFRHLARLGQQRWELAHASRQAGSPSFWDLHHQAEAANECSIGWFGRIWGPSFRCRPQFDPIGDTDARHDH